MARPATPYTVQAQLKMSKEMFAEVTRTATRYANKKGRLVPQAAVLRALIAVGLRHSPKDAELLEEIDSHR